MPKHGEKISGKNFPTPADPIDRVCFRIEIPDALEYRAALMGQIDWLADWRCWRHSEIDYGDPPTVNREIAGLFAQAISTSEFGDCGDMEICERIIECINTDEDVREAFNQWLIEQISTNPGVAAALSELARQEAVTGRSLTPGQAAANLLPQTLIDDCTKARLGAAMEFLAEYIHTLITDFFEVLISLDTAAKLAAKASGLIPVVGQYVETAAEFLIEMKNKIIVTYAAEMTGEVLQSIAGDWFCKAEPDCDLSIDDAIAVIVERLGTISPAEFGTIMNTIVTGTFVGVQIVETAFLVALAAVKFGGKFGDQIGVNPMSVIMAQGAGVPNSYWNDYECPDYSLEAQNVGILYLCGSGVIATIPFAVGVPFNVPAVLDGATTEYMVVLKLPAGAWHVELTNFSGTVTPPTNLYQTAWAYHDAAGAWHNAQWNAPASPATFPGFDTIATVFSPWCNSQDWNLVLFNEAPFTARFVVTAIP